MRHCMAAAAAAATMIVLGLVAIQDCVAYAAPCYNAFASNGLNHSTRTSDRHCHRHCPISDGRRLLVAMWQRRSVDAVMQSVCCAGYAGYYAAYSPRRVAVLRAAAKCDTPPPPLGAIQRRISAGLYQRMRITRHCYKYRYAEVSPYQCTSSQLTTPTATTT